MMPKMRNTEADLYGKQQKADMFGNHDSSLQIERVAGLDDALRTHEQVIRQTS